MANFFDKFDDHPPSGVTHPTDDSDAQTGFVPPTGPVRGTGLGVRNVIEGVLGGPYDLIARGINATGLLPPINSLSDNLSNWGLPTPQTPAERTNAAIIEPTASVLGPVAAGRALTTAAKPIVRTIGGALADQPVTQAVSAGAGGAATEATGDPRIGLAVSMASPFAITAANRGARAVENTAFGGMHPADAELGRLALTKYNIPINAPDLSDNSIIRLGADQMGKLPFSGARPSVAAKQEAWQGAIANEMGETGATNFRPDVMAKAKTRIGQAFDDVATRTAIPQQETSTMISDLAKIMPDAELVLDQHLPNIEKQIKEISNIVGRNNGTIPGDAYQALTRTGAPLDLLESSTDPNVAHFAGRIRDALDDAFVRSASPADQQALQQARYQYRIMRTVDQLAAGSRTGDITPDAFMQKVLTASRKFDAPTGGMAYTGGGNIGELARIGKLMRAPPNSGTADRAMINAAVGAYTGGSAAGGLAHMMDPSFAIGVPVALAANRAAGSYLRSGSLANRLIENAIGTPPTLQNQLMRAFQTSGVTGLEAELQQGKLPPTNR